MEPNWIAISNSKTLRPVLKATISEENPPEADFTYTPSEPTTKDEITFDASPSTDVDGTVVTYSWNLGDGVEIQTEAQTITHTYPVEGDYLVTLTVTDDTGFTNTISKEINIQNAPTT